MKRVWTTKKSSSHLADTPAHLWPSESFHHDRPPPTPPTPAFSALSLPTSAYLPLGQTHVVWLPGRCQTWLTRGGTKRQEGKEKERWAEPYLKRGDFVCDENILFMQKASVAVSGRVKEDYEAWLPGPCRSLFLPCR